MLTATPPQLLTPGRIASSIDEPLHRVTYVLATRPHILPSARAGTIRLYDKRAMAQVRLELNAIDAKRSGERS